MLHHFASQRRIPYLTAGALTAMAIGILVAILA